MTTVIATTKLKKGAEQEWDAMIRRRSQSVQERPGWISSQLLTPATSSAFIGQRGRLEALEAEPSTSAWYTVVADGKARLG